MIGNDIIDLSAAKLESNWQRRGFLEKQFTKNEQRQILSAQNSFVCVWRIWSMKEAAYKIYTQQNELRFFAPKKLILSPSLITTLPVLASITSSEKFLAL